MHELTLIQYTVIGGNEYCDMISYFAEHQVTVNGFKCPDQTLEAGVLDPHPKYADPEDCAKFYICLNGVTPRAQGCELGLVYNDVTKQCDGPENVPEW